ncbi:MAG: prepilin-type N-terminal cleavage/methylation domain-containing protein [Deltaproteobacteria bacterium]|nr:prepilin-type N-terminal cleavage/methylation domain-containing protein [Deltaproteobacteria bacterium]
MTQREKRKNGFTLIELIIVIVLLGIVGAMGAGFISSAFKGFFDTDARMEMYEEGKTALVRMEREIHIAVPNAVDVSIAGDTISFGVIDETAMTGVFGQYMEEHPTDTKTITDQTAPLPVINPQYPILHTLISIYNTTWEDFAVTANNRVYNIITPAIPPLDPKTMTLDRNIGPASPYGRYYAVRPEAVRFSVANGVLSRSTATVTAGSNLGGFGGAQTLAQHVQQAIDPITSNPIHYFTYEPGTSARNSVVVIHFAIHRTETDETVNFHKEIQIRNVP